MNYCKNCNKVLKVSSSTWCSNTCRHQFARKSLLEDFKKDPSKGTKSGHRLKSSIRDYIFQKFGNKCSICGWNEINPSTGKSPLEIDHIDGDCTNNSEHNLRVLCPNCHSLTPTYKALNKGNANKERLKYFKLI